VPELERAPAKLTVSLAVTGVRPDGYHLVDAEMVSLDLADELEFGAGDELVVLDEARSGMEVRAGPDNLVARALALVGRRARVVLRKRIPAGAGLGGGSSDAAAVLRWAGRGDDIDLAMTLGADVAFCLRGGRARVRGIGEVVEALPALDRVFTLLTPPFGCSTPVVYRRWDALGSPVGARNDLESAALAAYPDLARWRDELAEATGVAPTLAGSGSTWFVEGAFPGPGRVVTRTDRPGGAVGRA